MFYPYHCYVFICDDCGYKTKEFYSVKEARAYGWAIAKNYINCYCPRCAPFHRHTGRNGATCRLPFQSEKTDKK